MLQHISGIVLLAAVTASLSHAASFDCKRASTAVEKLICNDPDLSRLDSELNARYRERLAAAPGLVEEQRSWLAKRNACNSTACIKLHYLDRLSEVTERGKSLADIASRLEIPKYERDRDFCPRLLDHLKRWQDVVVVAPVVTADSIDAATLRDRLGSCDPKKFAEHYVIEPRVWEAGNLDAISDEEERNSYGIGYVMRGGFRLYEMNIDPDPRSGIELVLYGASVRQIDGDPLETGFGSRFKVIDMKQCRITDERFVSDVINSLDTFVGVLEFAGERYLFDASHHTAELLWSITFTRPEPAGSANLERSCSFIAKDENPVPIGAPVGTRRPGDPSYGDIRIEVPVSKAARVSTSTPRPANFYQLAGNAGGQGCRDSLEVLNRPGAYSGDDVTRWLLDSPDQVEFRSLQAGAATYAFPGLEYASVDVNGDGQAEHVYRLNSVLHSQWHQELMITPYSLQNHPERLAPYGQECLRVDPAAGCDSANTRIRFALRARAPDKLPDEWGFTRNDIWTHITDDTASQRLLFPHDRNRADRNVGLSNAVYWSLYEKRSSVIAVSAPIHDFATPELLVFAPREKQSGVLLCVIMPVAWHK
jgi:uncharacterized protein YecT (DUF1311 family)